MSTEGELDPIDEKSCKLYDSDIVSDYESDVSKWIISSSNSDESDDDSDEEKPIKKKRKTKLENESSELITMIDEVDENKVPIYRFEPRILNDFVFILPNNKGKIYTFKSELYATCKFFITYLKEYPTLNEYPIADEDLDIKTLIRFLICINHKYYHYNLTTSTDPYSVQFPFLNVNSQLAYTHKVHHSLEFGKLSFFKSDANHSISPRCKRSIYGNKFSPTQYFGMNTREIQAKFERKDSGTTDIHFKGEVAFVPYEFDWEVIKLCNKYECTGLLRAAAVTIATVRTGTHAPHIINTIENIKLINKYGLSEEFNKNDLFYNCLYSSLNQFEYSNYKKQTHQLIEESGLLNLFVEKGLYALAGSTTTKSSATLFPFP